MNFTTTSVLIVGAGPAGLGVATALKHAGLDDVLVIDTHSIGAAFRAWPREMNLLTPSFNSNSFGLVDLNAIDPVTSPADFLHTQHPNGEKYADYLNAIATHYQLEVQEKTRLISIEKMDGAFQAKTSQGTIVADNIVWAAGQFFYPRERDFPGAEHALHSSRVGSWAKLEGESFTVIGGYESGVDAALNLVELGKRVTLLSRGEPWTSDHPDPSRSLSPRTFDRLRALLLDREKHALLTLQKNTSICHIEKNDGWWTLRDQDEIPLVSHTQPILANGFTGSLQVIDHLFEKDANGLPVFTEEADESTLTPGIFYAGPQLVHRNALFCFIYKFRARFGVIAAEIAERVGLPDVEERLEPYLKAGFMNRDLDCCTNCECAITEDQAPAPEPAAFAHACRPTATPMFQLLSHLGSTLLLFGAIILGSLIGGFFPVQAETLGSAADPLILVLVSLLFFEISFGKITEARGHLRFLSLTWVTNFILIPLIGWGIASLFLSGQPLLFTGLLIYFIAPCTDWFLGFTRLARGNVVLGSVLVPINLISQVVLFPVFLGLFAGKSAGVDVASIGSTLWHWFFIPFLCAVVLHEALKRFLTEANFSKLLGLASALVPLVIAALVTCIFSGNIGVILGNLPAFLVILAAVFVFFLTTYVLGEFVSSRFRLAYPEHALLSMTTAARNAPLMLGLTTAAFPGQPLIYAALIIGMLVEFPHLTLLKCLLFRQRASGASVKPPAAVPSLTESQISQNFNRNEIA